jgi:two-component system sensor histidine kinase YesM
LNREKEAIDKQRVAEIKALEAQINPHFLYNTLDTINWMAIEKDAFDISNAISSLANILRYAITNYSEAVEIQDEVEWLKNYVFLQQYRFKNRFVCHIDVQPEVMHEKIHKLLIQPFVENAIIHGFDKGQEQYILRVEIGKTDGQTEIVIADNGKGMDAGLVADLNRGFMPERTSKEHIGIENALNRLHQYCDGTETVVFQSEPGKGTQIRIRFFPKE